MNRKAKIVATIGPSSDSEPVLRKLILSGLDVARLNFSHGTYSDHANRIHRIRELSDQLGKPIPILQDLQGPKLRVGNISEKGIELVHDQKIRLTSIDLLGKNEPDETIIPIDVPNLLESVHPADHILMDDGNLEIEVLSIGKDYIEAKVITGGILKSHKGVNLPGVDLKIPAITNKDISDLAFGLENEIDLIAISFVHNAEDIAMVRDQIKRLKPEKINTPIIAKLERPEAIDHLEAILEIADGVMVARGDLAVETSPASVPILQKRIIQAANQHSKVVITATQMLESMINNPRPTRAEASDVANAIFDGTDAVMLSAETASGNYPIDSVRMMDQIICEAEEHFCDWGICNTSKNESSRDDAISITLAARELAHDRNVASIAVFTLSGKTAILMSKARPQVPILAFTPSITTFQTLGLYWGVTPLLVPYANTLEAVITHVDTAIVASTTNQPGQQVVIISGFPIGAMRQPNFALLHTIGEAV